MDKVEERKRKRNERRREAYQSMQPEDKAKLLERRRQRYGERMVRLRSQLEIESGTSPAQENQNFSEAILAQTSTPPCISELQNVVNEYPTNNVQVLDHAVSDDVIHELMPDPTYTNEYHSPPRNRHYDRFSRLKSIATSPWELPVASQCQFCQAYKFFREPPAFCCANGEVSLAPMTPNPILLNLFTVDTSGIGIRFRRRVRTYNNHLALTSIGMKTDPQFCWSNQGIYTLKVNGQVTHKLDAFNSSIELPRRLQLFFLDTADNICLDSLKKYDLEAEILTLLLQALANNPYFKIFKRLRSWDNLENCIVVLRANPQVNQKTHNLPNEQQIAAIWDETTDDPEDMNRDIRVHGSHNHSHSILYHYGCYDPLQYPLLFPHGETGWHAGIERNSHSRGVSAAYCAGENSVAPALGLSASTILEVENQVYTQNRRKRTNVSCREHTAFRCQIRD